VIGSKALFPHPALAINIYVMYAMHLPEKCNRVEADTQYHLFIFSELRSCIFLIGVVKNIILYLSFEKSFRNIISFHLPVVYNSSKTVGKISRGFSAFQRTQAGR